MSGKQLADEADALSELFIGSLATVQVASQGDQIGDADEWI